MFKDQILAQLVTKYPGVSKKFLGLWADKLAPKVTEEIQIEGVINELDNLPVSITDLATELQKEGDERVSAAKAKWGKQPAKQEPAKPKEDGAEPPAPIDEPPAWARPMMEELKALRIEKTQSTISQSIASNQKLQGIPASYYNKRRMPESETEIEAFIDDVAKDYGVLKQELTDQGFSQGVKPPIGIPVKSGEKVSAMMQAFLDEKKQTEPQK